MKKVLKYTGLTLLTLITLILLYLGCAWLLSRMIVKAQHSEQPEIVIYLKGNGVHTDIVVPVRTSYKDWSRSILYKNTRGKDTSLSYLAFGWGDKGFYLQTPTWADLKFSTAFNATFGLSSAAMHTTFYKDLREGPLCVRLNIDRDQYQRLVAYIENSLRTDTNMNPLLIPTEMRYDNEDAFYEAKGSYNLFHTCNTWANNALKACGQKACWWTPFEGGVFHVYGK
jgi:uncharacterized protein (TIGR02117 family)